VLGAHRKKGYGRLESTNNNLESPMKCRSERLESRLIGRISQNEVSEISKNKRGKKGVGWICRECRVGIQEKSSRGGVMGAVGGGEDSPRENRKALSRMFEGFSGIEIPSIRKNSEPE